MKKVYISLPISGRPIDEAKQHAASVARRVAAKGYIAINPLDLPINEDAMRHLTDEQRYRAIMGADISVLLACDAICLCDGWKASRGCRIELAVAEAECFTIIKEEDL